jgi:FAD/FMN-containing dehydrogenase/Fe-S oxidoreductase
MVPYDVPDRELVAALKRAGVADVDGSALARDLYSSDASLYRVRPRVVARPRHPDEIAAALEVARTLSVPLTVRGAGTSIAGNAVGPGIVLDCSRHLGRIRSVDPEAGTATVEPGVVQADLQRAVAPLGLRFGPDPSTHNRATIGGMIGNNACGSRSLAYGRTSDNVVSLEVVTGEGRCVRLSADAADDFAPLRQLVSDHLGVVRTEFGRFPRQISGYGLEHLLPENGFDLTRAFVGSEGTWGIVRSATVRLVQEPAHHLLVVLGFPGMAEAADAVGEVLAWHPTTCEGMDERILDRMRERSPAAVPDLPRGRGWLLVELVGNDTDELADRARRLVALDICLDSAVVTDPAHQRAIWRIREDGAGLVARTADGRPAYAGWEDAAVPVPQLGRYLREFDELCAAHALSGVPYGHFGDGCVHVRLDLPLGKGPDRGRAAFRAFLADAARLVVSHGGSLSGEHGDGRARSELLATMYSPQAVALMAAVTRIFDPEHLLNPGVLVDPDAADELLRTTTMRTSPLQLTLGRGRDSDLVTAAHRCTGVGKCRAATDAGVMCPSFLATREEKDSTRGRARALQELLQGDGDVDWRAQPVHAALDLCLSCKGCARDCPTGVDMAAMKTEVLHRAYQGQRRPVSHYTLGRLPAWSDAAARAPELTNLLLRSPFARWGAAMTGVDKRRRLPTFARRTFQQAWHGRPPRAGSTPPAAPHGTVALWVDSFTDHFAPQVAVAAARVLEAAGYRVDVVGDDACCGLTWLTTGQLDQARARMTRTVEVLGHRLDAGERLVALEPSCLSAVRGDGPVLVGTPAADRVAQNLRSLAELLTATPGWEPPSLQGVAVVAQPHCHQYAVVGWDTDAALLRRAGAAVDQVSGCCGLAGNWGAEKGHHDVSMAIAGLQLVPALDRARPGTVVLADGFSCRTQLEQLGRGPGHHLAQLLDQAGRTCPG